MKREEIMREGIMKGFLVLAGCLSIGLAVVCRPAAALAAPKAVVAIVGLCQVLEDDCATTDATFIPDSSRVSVNGAGVWTSTCAGTTTVTPTKATKCVGETLNGTAGDTSPQFACGMELLSGSANGPVFTDDWSETITPSGHVTMTCKFNPNESGK
jgi:hypothetical protein